MDDHAHERVLTELDHARPAALSSRRPKDRRPASPGIDAVLDDARSVPSRRVGPDIVTMYSRVLLRQGEAERRLTICYPDDAQPQSGFVSVLSPVGLSLLGRHVGAAVRWRSPDGSERRAEVDAILFQPEASGDYTT